METKNMEYSKWENFNGEGEYKCLRTEVKVHGPGFGEAAALGGTFVEKQK